jgi:hypothetical protein
VDQNTARIVLESLLERAKRSAKETFLTSIEIDALAVVLEKPGPAEEALQPVYGNVGNGGQDAVLATVVVDPKDIPQDTIVCVDFGTSFSKAFASVDGGADRPRLIDLPIGNGSTGSRLTTPSELMIDGGRIYFGPFARKHLEDTQSSVDRLIDSIKQFITLNSDVSLLSKTRLEPTQDPSQSLSRRDVLILYLAHLMQLTETALVDRGLSPNARRRFAHPAWKDASRDKNEREMRIMMAEAIVLSRSVGAPLSESIGLQTARTLLDQLRELPREQLPQSLIDQPVREATAAGAGALLTTPENGRESFLIVDIGAGTTDVAGFVCVNNPKWDRARVFEITGAADAKNMAGNVLDAALQKMVLEKSALVQDTEEYRAAAMSVRRDRRVLKEQLFKAGEVLVPLPTDETIRITLEEFQRYPSVVTFREQIREMVARSAAVLSGDLARVNLVATGGGASLPLIKELEQNGLRYGDKQISFAFRESIAAGVRETNPDLVEPYPQIAVALGGALPDLPEQKSSVLSGLTATPSHYIKPMYKS